MKLDILIRIDINRDGLRFGVNYFASVAAVLWFSLFLRLAASQEQVDTQLIFLTNDLICIEDSFVIATT